MEPLTIASSDEAEEFIRNSNTHNVKVGVFDIDGVLRGKYISKSKFLSALKSGFGFCDVVLGWDSNDQLYDNVKLTGWHTGYPDAQVRIIPESIRPLPLEGDGFLFLGEFAGAAEQICPRGVLKRVVEKARSMGFEPYSAFEYEFFMFAETPYSAREKGYRDLTPWTPGNFGYSVIRNSVYSGFYHELMKLCREMRFELEGLHTETGPGVLEAAITVDESLLSADKAALFKTFTKVLAQRHDLMATFMAKWSAKYPGQSGHIHISLQNLDKDNVFYDPKGPHGMSKLHRHFTAGCQKLMPQVLAMVASTVNSYTRLVPGFWAPTNPTWGEENRTCALRVIGGDPKAQRLEYRIAAADANPYLALAAALLSGLHGIENELEPSEPIRGNAYALPPDPETALPSTLWEAAQRLKACQEAREVLGDAFVEHFAATREWEEREFRRSITDWEMERYFEII
ncbi:MAG: glutamine synthetase [Vulcanimicrobiota bacterium]